MEIPKLLKDEIWNYCRLNDITNIDEFTIKLLRSGFTIEKYGATPQVIEKTIEKIIEKIVEVPVEKIVERIVEVPITLIDTEISDALKKRIKLHEECEKKLLEALNLTKELEKQLEIEKNKKKTDLYGE
jgi:hypothetical protein